MQRIAFVITIIGILACAAFGQQSTEQRAALTDAAVGLDAKGAPAIEGRLLTQVLTGSDESPVTNVKVAVKNVTPVFYTYVSGWATFYDAQATRCGEGLFKLDALAPQESAEVDTPGLRLRCSPSTWRGVATILVTRTVDIAKPVETQPPAADPTPATQPVAPTNLVI